MKIFLSCLLLLMEPTKEPIWYVSVPGMTKVVKVRAKDRLSALVDGMRPTVWTEEEWKATEAVITKFGPAMNGFSPEHHIEIEDRTK